MIRHMDGFDLFLPQAPEYQQTNSNYLALTVPEVSGRGRVFRVARAQVAVQTPPVIPDNYDLYLKMTRNVGDTWGDWFGIGIAIQGSGRTGGNLCAIETQSGDQLITFGIAGGFCTVNDVATPIAFENNIFNYVELEIDKIALKMRAWVNNILVSELDMPAGVTTIRYWFGIYKFQDRASGGPFTLFDFDDLYEADGTGGINNTRLGRVQIVTRPPQADEVAEFTRSGGATNASCVADMVAGGTNPAVHDANATYVSSNVPGAVDLYTNADDLPVVDATVLAVGVTVIGRKEGPDARELVPMISVDGESQVGDRVTLAVATWNRGTTVFNTNPKTADVWDEASAKAASFGQMVAV